MSDVLVEERTCTACGAEIRRDTQFCYNCGASLEPVLEGEKQDPSPENNGEANASLIPDIRSKDSAPNPGIRNSESMQSAASLRRRTKTLDRKPREVIWEPVSGGPNVLLIISTIILVTFAVIVVGMALYYR